MTKAQKIWLWVSVALFVVPEVLWSPVGNLVNDLLQNSNEVQIFRPNFLTDSDNTTSLLFVLFIQVVGLVSSLIIVSKLKINIWIKSSVIIILVLFLLVTGLLFYIGFSLRHGISF